MLSRCLRGSSVVKQPSFLFTRKLSSIHPTLASGGDPKKIVTKLPLERIATMIMSGKPNRPFPPEFGVDIEDFTQGALQAVNMITTSVQMEDWQSLEGLVSDPCIHGLQLNLDRIPLEDRLHMSLNPKDVFFSFITDFDSKDDKQTLCLVTFSMPRLSEIKEIMQEAKDVKEMSKEDMEELRNVAKNMADMRKEGKAPDLGKIIQVAQETKTESKEKFNEAMDLFQENEILIGNYRFERVGLNGQWSIVEVNQIDSREAWAWIFQKRWKGRLGFHVRGVDFHKVLRFDYATDFFIYLLIFNFYSAKMLAGGMISAPHS